MENDDSEVMKDIRKNAIIEIKEKVKNNPKYVHPCNKEFQEDIKRFGFNSGYNYITWMQQNGVLKNPSDFNREHHIKTREQYKCKDAIEYMNLCAQKLGYKDRKERRNEYEWAVGIRSPMSDNKDCSAHFGIYKGEELFKKFLEDVVFEYVEKTDYHDGGIDFKCKSVRQEFIDRYPQFRLERNKEYKIQLKVRCLRRRNKNSWWDFTHIDYNNVPDYFILVGWDNRECLQPMYVWMFHKDDIIRGKSFWTRRTLTITNKYQHVLCFKRYELINELESFKEIYRELKERDKLIIDDNYGK